MFAAIPTDARSRRTLNLGAGTGTQQTARKEGLLDRIGNNGMIFMPDFSTLLDGNRDRRDEVFAQLRRVYDGDLRKEFAIADLNTTWSGRLTIGVAVTPKVDRYTPMFGALRERFVMIRWKRVGGVDAAVKAMHQDHAAKNATMRKAVQTLLAVMKEGPEPEIPAPLARAIRRPPNS